MSANILVIEDEPAIQELIAVNLEHAGYRTMQAKSAEQAASLMRQTLPDLILLDWMLPGQSGVSLAKSLRQDERTRQVPIIMLTARSEEDAKITGLEAGADDYVTKPFSPRELLARIRAVLRRRSPQLTDETIEIGGLRLEPATHRVSANDTPIELGPTEFRLLHFLTTHPEVVHSRARLLDRVWGDHVFVEERTVDVHIRRLRQALEPGGLDNLIETVRGAGYRIARRATPDGGLGQRARASDQSGADRDMACNNSGSQLFS